MLCCFYFSKTNSNSGHVVMYNIVSVCVSVKPWSGYFSWLIEAS